ncbi:MAG: phytanoyl-CoA dioxygenase family protein [Armatimonas sp.]
MALTEGDIQGFIQNGYVRLRQAFPRELAEQCRQLLWEQTGLSPEDPEDWNQPVIRLGSQTAEPFRQAANTPRLYSAFDQLVGPGRWIAHPHLAGTVVIRFPVDTAPDDDGWHIDTSFEHEGRWHANIHSKGRALLMLFLFSEVTESDAPTRIRVGSHLDIPRVLAPAGEVGLSFDQVPLPIAVQERPIALATGEPGDVYLCHPFLVHAGSRHHGANPRFLAQPGLLLREPIQLDRSPSLDTPVEAAIRLGLS